MGRFLALQYLMQHSQKNFSKAMSITAGIIYFSDQISLLLVPVQ